MGILARFNPFATRGDVQSTKSNKDRVSQPRRIRARYDAATPSDTNAAHWLAADGLSAVRANSPAVRLRLRKNSRYECGNNPYLRGITDSVASFMIGQGPTLALQYAGSDSEATSDPAIRTAASQVERRFGDWMAHRQIVRKLVEIRQGQSQDGEGFGIIVSAEDDFPVATALRVVECDHFDEPYENFNSDGSGVRTNPAGDPVSYAFQPHHPGDGTAWRNEQKWSWLPARYVCHAFRSQRPGQKRGIPETTPSLEIAAVFRRFLMSTITAAEAAASISAVIKNEGANLLDDETQTEGIYQSIQWVRNMMLELPGGQDINQLKAEHPNAQFDTAIRVFVAMMARPMHVPAVIALGDASEYNYASGRLDLQTFQRQNQQDQLTTYNPILCKLYREWLREARLVPGYLPSIFVETIDEWRSDWRWGESEHVDRAKEAAGQQTELENNSTTLQREYAKRGLDWEKELQQRGREVALLKELGLTVEQSARSLENVENKSGDA